MGMLLIFSIVIVVCFIRTVSFGIWTARNGNACGAVALFALAILTGVSGVVYIMT